MLAVPVPIAFTAFTLNIYVVSIVKPVTVAEVAVEVPSENTVYDDPPFDEGIRQMEEDDEEEGEEPEDRWKK